MGINDLVCRGIDDRVRDLSRTSHQVGHQEHHHRGGQISLAGSHKSVVIELEKAQAGISRELSSSLLSSRFFPII